MKDGVSCKKVGFLVIIGIVLFYFGYYKRYFIYSKDGTKSFTLWKVSNHCSYLIPGKYFSPIYPKSNYLYFKNQHIYSVFNTGDDFEIKFAVYYKINTLNLSRNKVYKFKDSLFIHYEMIDTIEPNGKIVYNLNYDSIEQRIDFRIIDLNRIYGIKKFN